MALIPMQYEEGTVKVVSGNLTAETGDYTIANAIPSGYKVMCGRWYTTYNQYRPLSVGQNGTTLIVMGAGANMANRPYEIFCT